MTETLSAIAYFASGQEPRFAADAAGRLLVFREPQHAIDFADQISTSGVLAAPWACDEDALRLLLATNGIDADSDKPLRVAEVQGGGDPVPLLVREWRERWG